MNRTLYVCLLAAQTAVLFAQPDPAKAPPMDMKEMMAKAKRFTQPGEAHKILTRFVGNWTTETTIRMPGAKPSAGAMKCAWMMADRWLECRGNHMFLGRPTDFFYLFGYDNFKMSYRIAGVTSMDTAMNIAEGDMDPGGKALIAYGTLDEYLTGEHDKMVRYVWRFESADVILMEVHDLPIGEKNTLVLTMKYTRK